MTTPAEPTLWQASPGRRALAPPSWTQSARLRRRVLGLCAFIFLAAGAVIILLPFGWLVSTSLKRPAEVFVSPPQWIPPDPQWSNYREVIQTWPFLRYGLNTVYVTLMVMLGSLLSCSLAGYSFARLRWRGRNVIFFLSIMTMMIPAQVTMIPLFSLFVALGWVDTLLPLYVPAFFGSAFFIFLFRQFFMSIPRSLEDAARIDGCGYLGIYWHVVVPLSVPSFITVAIFTFIGTWNDFMGPLIYISSESKRTLALALSFYQNYFYGGIHLHTLMAASLMVLLPCIIVFFIFQRHLIQGMILSGIKG